MPLILAIEPDRRQAAQLREMVRQRLRAELVLGDTAEAVLKTLGDRVPDLVLTTALLSPKDETLLTEKLRALEDAAAHVQTLTIPVLDSPRQNSGGRRMLSVFMGDKATGAAPDGCDPAVFAEQCAEYLERAASERGPDVHEESAAIDVQSVATAAHTSPHVAAIVENDTDEIAAADFEVADAASESIVLPPMIAAVDTPSFEIVQDDDDDAREEQAPDGFNLDLSSLLDEAVVNELSAAIENVTASEPARRSQPRAKSRTETSTAVPVGNKRQWPKMDGYCAEVSRPQPVPEPVRHAAPEPAAEPPKRRLQRPRPAQDEWDLYDPAQCGFAALLAKLDEITDLASPLPSDKP